MKRLLTKTIVFAVFASLPAYSSTVVVDYQGEPMVTSHNIEQRLIINSDDSTRYNIAVRPLEEYVSDFSGNVKIPLEYLYINNNREDVYMRYNEYSNLLNGVEMGGISKSITAKIKNYGIVPAGVYSINFEVQATNIDTGEIANTTNFNLRFVVPVIHELSTYSEMPRINVGTTDAFSKNKKIPMENATRVFVRSNTDWILSLDTSNFGEMIGNYYVRTTFGSPGVTNRLSERALIVPGREIVLARGKAPAVNEQVAVEFSVENPSGKIMRAGEYNNKIRYVLREGKN